MVSTLQQRPLEVAITQCQQAKRELADAWDHAGRRLAVALFTPDDDTVAVASGAIAAVQNLMDAWILQRRMVDLERAKEGFAP